MTITVKFFASLSEEVGRRAIAIESSEPMTVAQLWQQACDDVPLPTHVLMAINMQYVDRNTLVRDGDEVAFFPPVTGG